MHACMGTCPFSPCSPPLLLRLSPHPLPAISRANLKLRYYESCTRCVGGRFKTSTPSINRPMGPTSWLNRPVPAPDDLSSGEANSRSRSYTQTLLRSVSPPSKNLFWWLLDSPLSPTSSKALNSQQPLHRKPSNYFLSLSDGHETKLRFCLTEACVIHCFARYIRWKNKRNAGHYKCFPSRFMWLAEVGHYPPKYRGNE